MKMLLVLLVSAPLLSAVFLMLNERGARQAPRVSLALAVGVFAVAGWLLGWRIHQGVDVSMALLGGWPILRLDALGALMAFVIAGISLVVHAYSVRYMAEEEGQRRYYALLDALVFSLLLMVLAGDLLSLLLAWNLVGVLLFFLLGHNVRRPAAGRYAGWGLLTFRVGDVALILAAVLLFDAYETLDLAEIFQRLQQEDDRMVAQWVGALVAFAAMARSAQFLLHAWLPYTMEGPTPVSALMHAGIVNAGGILINRFAPVFAHTDGVLPWLFVIGLFTAVVGSILMLCQNDIKKSLGYSTMGQMGFMIMECGVGAFSLAIYHLIAHGIFKGTLFLGAGGIINEARKHDGVPKDPLYRFVVERGVAVRRPPWKLMAAMTLIVPLLVLGVAHWLVDEEILQKQGALVLLFFGWITGAQLIFSTYKAEVVNLTRFLALMLFSFVIVVIGYVLVSHVFDLFLYPDPAFRASLYAAADIELIWFELVLLLVAVVVVVGWVLVYYADEKGGRFGRGLSRAWLRFYALVSREFYVPDVQTLVSERLLKLARSLNRGLRWM